MVEVGNETIDGVDTVHYEVTVDVADAIAASPQAGSKLGEVGVDLPDTVTYDVWVTSDNQLRRASFDVTVADQTVAMVLDMRPSDQPLADAGAHRRRSTSPACSTGEQRCGADR